MHNHVLADVDQSWVDAVGCRSSGFPSSDQSEDSDYDSIWITHTNRMGSMSRKSCCSYIHFVCIESGKHIIFEVNMYGCEHIEDMDGLERARKMFSVLLVHGFHRTETLTILKFCFCTIQDYYS